MRERVVNEAEDFMRVNIETAGETDIEEESRRNSTESCIEKTSRPYRGYISVGEEERE